RLYSSLSTIFVSLGKDHFFEAVKKIPRERRTQNAQSLKPAWMAAKTTLIFDSVCSHRYWKINSSPQIYFLPRIDLRSKQSAAGSRQSAKANQPRIFADENTPRSFS